MQAYQPWLDKYLFIEIWKRDEVIEQAFESMDYQKLIRDQEFLQCLGDLYDATRQHLQMKSQDLYAIKYSSYLTLINKLFNLIVQKNALNYCWSMIISKVEIKLSLKYLLLMIT